MKYFVHKQSKGHQTLGVFEISDTYIPTKVLEIWREYGKVALGGCCHLQPCKSVVNIVDNGVSN